MAEVWRAVHRAQRKTVAVKVVTIPAGREVKFRRLFVHELQNAARLNHASIVQLLDYGEIPASVAESTNWRLPRDAPYLVMEWLPGGTLGAKRGQIRWPELRANLLVLLDALAHAHARGVIHRDLKTDNVLVGERGPVLTDFGLAHSWNDDELTADQVVMAGTPNYMAPEQVLGEWRALGPWTDLYAMGCFAWSLACRHAPFAGRKPVFILQAQVTEKPPAFKPKMPMPPGFEDWLRRLLTKKPSARFQYAADAALALLKLPDAADRVGAILANIPDGEDDEGENTVVTPPVFLPVTEVSWAEQQGCSKIPPMPISWRRPENTHQNLELHGVGQALFRHRERRFFGRIKERDTLWRTLRETLDGQTARMVLFRGPAGHGKRRIARWLANRAHELGQVISAYATHDDPPGPSSGLGPMMARLTRSTGLTGTRRAKRIRDALGLDNVQDELVVAVAAATDFDWQFEQGGVSVTLGSETDHYAAICDGLTQLARDRGVVLCLDNLQWGWNTVRFCEHVLRQEKNFPFLIIASLDVSAEGARIFDHVFLNRLRSLPQFQCIDLGALEEADHRRLIQSYLPFDPALVDQLVGRTQGNPLFADELIQHWIESDALESGSHGFRLTGRAQHSLPGQVGDVWAERITLALREAEPSAAEALEIAAALGHEVMMDEWAAVCERAGFEFPINGYAELRNARLITEATHDGDNSSWRFNHPMLGEALQEKARQAGRWAECNRFCAEILSEREDIDPQRLANHWMEAKLYAQAVSPLLEAADRFLEHADFGAARTVLLNRARALRATGVNRFDTRWTGTRVRWAECYAGRADYESARRWSGRAATEAQAQGNDRLYVRALRTLGNMVSQIEEPSRATETFVVAATVARRLNDSTMEARALEDLARNQAYTGQISEARALYDDGLAALGDRAQWLQGRLLSGLTDLARREGDMVQAATLCEEALDCLRAAGLRQTAAECEALRGDLARYRGDTVEAERHYREAKLLFDAKGSPIEAEIQCRIVPLLMESGRFEEAQKHMLSILAHPVTGRYGVTPYLARTALLVCAAESGTWSLWDRHVQRLEPLFSCRITDPVIADLALLAAAAARRNGAPDHAAQGWRLAHLQFTTLGRTDDADRVKAIWQKG